ncbi:hypothetical protein H2198_002779 [Neophaeococcomyces mojaviensis]|uniref:Uncharacterized protein n=1 Tax=Neophaeococcomyces mojaviensis TaxID=3383035 RepID=A0ACC3AD76_9EURO|nr:hypothetical protein H2198_002779 [Knufia sp. JES_112]
MAIEEVSVSFCTFGMFIIDEIEWNTPDPPPTKYDLIGGAGTYAVLGARLAVSPSVSLARSISWIVDMGSDFPASVKDTIDSWSTNCIFRHDMNRLTTRAWNGYGLNDWRDFKYLTPKVRLEVSSLNSSQIMSKSFHMVCSPQRCIDITTRLREARLKIGESRSNPIIVWEPIPDLCSPEELESLQIAAKNCSVISPNHDELRLFFPEEKGANQADLVMSFMGWTSSSQTERGESVPVLIVREGSNGSTAYFRTKPAAESTSYGAPKQTTSEFRVVSVHLPAYHTPSTVDQVVDPTGGGNTYLGALAVSMTDVHVRVLHPSLKAIYLSLGWVSESDLFCHGQASAVPLDMPSKMYNQIQTVVNAMIHANIAASFAIEQNGVPALVSPESNMQHGAEVEGRSVKETWNGEAFLARLQTYLDREASAIRQQIEQTKNMLRRDTMRNISPDRRGDPSDVRQK